VDEAPELALEVLEVTVVVVVMAATMTPQGDKSLILLVRLPLAMLLWVELLESNPSISISHTNKG